MRCRLNRLIACKPLTQFFYLFIYLFFNFLSMASIASGRRAACPDCVPFGSVFAVFIHPAQSARLLTKCR